MKTNLYIIRCNSFELDNTLKEKWNFIAENTITLQ